MAIVEERLDEDKHFIIVGDFKCGADDPLDLYKFVKNTRDFSHGMN